MGTKSVKIFLDDRGSFLGRGEGCLIVRDRKGTVEQYPLFENEIREVHVRIGNSLSSAALATCAFWGIDLLILTQRGNPVAYVKSLEYDSHVKTRICQYESLKNGKGVAIAKNLVLSRIEGQNIVLRKYGFRQHDVMRVTAKVNKMHAGRLAALRRKLLPIEGQHTQRYFNQIFRLLPKAIMIQQRRTFKAYDGINNTFNLAYTVLKWKVLRAVIKAKLDPYLGFLHSEQFGKPSLVCDLMEPYRYVIDDYLIQYAQNLRKNDFSMKIEDFSRKRKGKRQYLKKAQATEFMRTLNRLFESTVDIPRIKHGNRQELETLINEEALLLAKYLRSERQKEWAPRLPLLS